MLQQKHEILIPWNFVPIQYSCYMGTVEHSALFVPASKTTEVCTTGSVHVTLQIMLKWYIHVIHIALQRYALFNAAIIHWKIASQRDCGKLVNVVACAGSILEETTGMLVTTKVSFLIFISSTLVVSVSWVLRLRCKHAQVCLSIGILDYINGIGNKRHMLNHTVHSCASHLSWSD